MAKATGTFEVKLAPLTDDLGLDASIGRLTIDKQFSGDLEGVSKGLMVSAGTAIADSAGYVAVERVSGTLHGRRGSFTLQHNATMNRGAGDLNIVVVPDSGADELTGLTGTMQINFTNGHSYEFDYTLPE